jgi:hypothetical protein
MDGVRTLETLPGFPRAIKRNNFLPRQREKAFSFSKQIYVEMTDKHFHVRPSDPVYELSALFSWLIAARLIFVPEALQP